MCARLPFDTWRHRHDNVKLGLVELAHHAHIECDSEIFGEFRHLIPAAALDQEGELGNVRARNGKVPDLRYRLPLPPDAANLPHQARAPFFSRPALNEFLGPENQNLLCCILNAVFCIYDAVCGILWCILFMGLQNTP